MESQTVFGYLHALETLSQLCSYDRLKRSYFIAADVGIEDAPKFKYREVFDGLARQSLHTNSSFPIS